VIGGSLNVNTTNLRRIAAILGVLAVLGWSCENDLEAVNAFDRKVASIEEGYDIEAIISQAANVKGILTAPYMIRRVTTPAETEFPKTLKVLFYDDSLKVTSQLTAQYGKMLDFERDVFLKDSVIYINFETGQRLDCEELQWDNRKQLFISNSFARISSPGDTLYGKGFEANHNFTFFKFISPYGSFPDSLSM
jgi:LPS export ABC transporter protein LptC